MFHHLSQYAVFLEEFDTAEADAVFAKADAMTTAEIAAEIAKGLDWDYQPKSTDLTQPPLRVPGLSTVKSVSAEPTETFKSRVPFLFWA